LCKPKRNFLAACYRKKNGSVQERHRQKIPFVEKMSANALAALGKNAGRLKVHGVEADGAFAMFNGTSNSCDAFCQGLCREQNLGRVQAKVCTKAFPLVGITSMQAI
jgi:hypothetical protein